MSKITKTKNYLINAYNFYLNFPVSLSFSILMLFHWLEVSKDHFLCAKNDKNKNDEVYKIIKH